MFAAVGHKASSTEVLVLVAALTAAALFFWSAGLSQQSLVLAVFLACCVTWAFGRCNDLSVAMAGLAGLALLGAVDQASTMKWLGHDTVWLIVGAFVMSSVLQTTGVATSLAQLVLRRVTTVPGLFAMICLTVAATAFLIPSTSARAALCVPIFMALGSAIPNRRVVRALALLFPTIVLLSAGAALTGAAAHVMALEFAASGQMGVQTGFLLWTALALPPSMAICATATWIIYRLMLGPSDRRETIALRHIDVKPITPEGWRALALAGLAIGMWATAPAHGIAMGVTAIAIAVTMTLPGVTAASTKHAFKSVEWELVLFMVMILAMGEALVSSGVAAWMAAAVAGHMSGANGLSGWAVTLGLIIIAMAAHLVVTSRTARVAVVLPAIGLPAVSLGLDPTTTVMAITLATGFCQTLTASAKPVAVYAKLDAPVYSSTDLLRLSAALAVPFALILWACAVFLWPYVLTRSFV